ncbi:MAG: peptidylprolyl isomerase [Opitutaceae bacterium]
MKSSNLTHLVRAGLIGMITLAVTACAPKETEVVDSDPVAIRVGEREIRLSELQAQIDFLNTNRSFGTEDTAYFMDQYLERQIALGNAYAEGLDQDLEIQRQWENLLIGRFKKTRMDQALASVSVTEEEVTEYYQANIDQYTRPAQVRLALMQLEKSGRDVEVIRQRMEEGRRLASDLPKDTRGFGALAVKYSEDATSRFKGGDVGWLQEGRSQYRWPAEVIESGFTLSENRELSPVIETDSGFYVIMRIDAREAVVRPLEGNFFASVQNQILKEKRAELTVQLKDEWATSVDVELQAEVIAELKFPTQTNSEVVPQALTRLP